MSHIDGSENAAAVPAAAGDAADVAADIAADIAADVAANVGAIYAFTRLLAAQPTAVVSTHRVQDPAVRNNAGRYKAFPRCTGLRCLDDGQGLGHHVSPQGAVPLLAKVDAVASSPRPRNVKSLQEFLGMVNFYNRFYHHAAQLKRPSYDALRGRRPAYLLDWSPEMTDAFDATKTTLAKAALLAHPSQTAPVALTTDASDYAVGAFCEQLVGGAWQPLAFFIRKLRDN